MSATRTQVYLSAQQRELIERRRARTGETMAEVVRGALDAYLDGDELAEQGDTLDATFGRRPDLRSTVPGRAEWDRSG